MTKPLAERFWAKVDKHGPDVCWPWTGKPRPDGYGRIGVGDGTRKLALAHRVAWELANGPIPDGLCVLHSCDNPPCCNDAHLFLGTRADNAADMISKGRDYRGPGQRGEAHGMSKLTEADIPTIRCRLAAGEVQRAIAADFDVTQTAISAVATGERWSHVR